MYIEAEVEIHGRFATLPVRHLDVSLPCAFATWTVRYLDGSRHLDVSHLWTFR